MGRPVLGFGLWFSMHCEEAQQLFDAYLDGELSPALTMELGAHRVRCPECRQALALLEVSGHILASDRDPVGLKGGFTDRLVACVDRPSGTWFHRVRRSAYVAGPLAAAAVIVLAFVGVFDRPDGEVASQKAEGLNGAGPPVEMHQSLPDPGVERPVANTSERNDRPLEAWLEQTQKNMAAKRQSGESLQKMVNLTIRQVLDILKQAEEASEEGKEALPIGRDAADSEPRGAEEAGQNDVEDL